MGGGHTVALLNECWRYCCRLRFQHFDGIVVLAILLLKLLSCLSPKTLHFLDYRILLFN